MVRGSRHHHIGMTPDRPPLFQFFLGAARESSQVSDDISSCVSHSSLTHIHAEKPFQREMFCFSCFGSFTTDVSPHTPPVSAPGIAKKWKMPSFLPCVLHYHEPTLSKWLLWILPSPCSAPKVGRSYAVSLILQRVPAEPNRTVWNARGFCFGQKGKGTSCWALWEGQREKEAPSDTPRREGVGNDMCQRILSIAFGILRLFSCSVSMSTRVWYPNLYYLGEELS